MKKQTDPEASSLRPLVSEKKCRDYLELIGVNSLSEAFEVIEKSSDDTAYIFRLCKQLEKYGDRQCFLEQEDSASRCITLLNIIAREQEFTKLSKRIEASVKQQIEKESKRNTSSANR